MLPIKKKKKKKENNETLDVYLNIHVYSINSLIINLIKNKINRIINKIITAKVIAQLKAYKCNYLTTENKIVTDLKL